MDLARDQERAAAAERAVLTRYVRRYGPVAWARAAPGDGREARTWHYWWHAHLLHVLHDAAVHRPEPSRRRLHRALARGVTVRTAGRWTTPYYDDIAWMGLALSASQTHRHARRRITRRLADGVDPDIGVLPWRVGSRLFNAPANAPGAMVLAADGHRAAAERIDRWVASTLDDPSSGLVRDGIEDGAVRSDLWTYNQGAAIGSSLALAPDVRGRPAAGGDDVHTTRARGLVHAVAQWCTNDDGLFPAAGGGDGGLFAGILARYLARASVDLAGTADPRGDDVAAVARSLVRRNADALWAGRRHGRFSADPRRAAGDDGDDLDLSVQLGAWITLEAAVDVAREVTS